jgi:hypothetical protein
LLILAHREDVVRSEEDGGAAQPSTEEDRDEQALQVFIISYRQFVSPTGFFTILEERYALPPPPTTHNPQPITVLVWCG